MKVNGKDWSSLDDKEKISYLEGCFDSAKSAVEKRHFEWYLNYIFLDGNHYASYNTVTNSLEVPPRKKSEVRLVINKTKSNIRAVKNYVTRSEPKWEVMPGDLDPDTITNAVRSGKLLDYIYRKLHLESTVSGLIDYVLNTSVAWSELDWDDKAEGGMGQIRIKVHDSFDIFPDPRAYLYGGLYKGRYIFKVIKRYPQEIANDKKYNYKNGRNRKDVKTDDELAASEMKSRLMRLSGTTEDEKSKQTTIKECLLYDEVPNSKKGNIKLVTYVKDRILREEDLKDKEFNMYCMQIDMHPNKIYQRSWTADAILLNKVLDRLFSQKVMYINQALIYRIIAEKGHGINEVSNQMGQVYEINKNRKWEQMQLAAYPSTTDTTINQVVSFIEDTLGSHDASMGGLPSGARSGKTLEALQAADSINLSGIMQSLNSYLSVLGSAILDMISEKYVASRVIKLTDPENGQGYMEVVGSEAPAKKNGATIINKDNEVIVKIGSWLGYTKEAQRETLLKLAELGVIPAEEILKQFEFPNIEELSAKARDQRLEQHQLDAEIAGRKQGESQPKPDPMIALADKEMMDMANGQDLPPTEGASIEHTQAHVDFTKTNTFTELPQDRQQAIISHYQGEAQVNGLMS